MSRVADICRGYGDAQAELAEAFEAGSKNDPPRSRPSLPGGSDPTGHICGMSIALDPIYSLDPVCILLYNFSVKRVQVKSIHYNFFHLTPWPLES
jgi:hypothetical protein